MPNLAFFSEFGIRKVYRPVKIFVLQPDHVPDCLLTEVMEIAAGIRFFNAG